MVQINVIPEKIIAFGTASISNTLVTSILTTLLLIIFVVFFQPKFLDAIVFWIFKFTDSITENRSITKKIFPLAATFLIFIGVANFISIFPGFLGSFYIKSGGSHIPLLRSPNSDLNITIALALVSVVGMEYFSISVLGIVRFFKRFLNFDSFENFFIGIFEFISEVTKLISFSFRLFGNVLAGEIVLLVAALFTPFFLPIPFLILETFVGLIQAFIFYVLTVSFIHNATVRHIEKGVSLQSD